MNIKAIRLQNFRGFRDASIELKPLTVLLGPNSSGKSSFGHALAAMAHADKVYGTGPQASLTPPATGEVENWPVDLGDTNDLRTAGATGPVRVGLVTREGLLELGFGGLEPHTADLLISYVLHPSGEQSAAAGAPAQMVLAGIPESQSGVVALGQTITASENAIEVKRVNERQWQEGNSEVSVILNGLVVKAVTPTSGTPRVLSGAASEDLTSLLQKLTYLRATRKRPSRGYQNGAGKQQKIGYSGEWTPSILLRRGDEQVTYREPPAVPQSTDEARTADYDWKRKRETLRNAVGSWLSRLDLATSVETIARSSPDAAVNMRVTLEGQAQHDITEIGFGVSQVIPVLVAGLLQPADSLFVVDLPEAHLHPRPQAALADFFCSLALSGRSALVETHSEMFFHRLRLRAAMNPKLIDDIAVYFIDRPKDGICCPPRAVGLRYEDELRWPEGFLHEAWETETYISAVREAQRHLPANLGLFVPAGLVQRRSDVLDADVVFTEVVDVHVIRAMRSGRARQTPRSIRL